MGDEIAGQGNQMGMEAVCLLDSLGEPLLRQKQSVMDVGNLNDAQAGKGGGKSVKPYSFLVHAEPITGTPSVKGLEIFPGGIIFDSTATPAAQPAGDAVA